MWLANRKRTKALTTVVLHATGGSSLSGAVSTLIARGLSYHYIIDKVGTGGFLNAKKRPLKRIEDICVFSNGVPVYYPIMEIRGKPRNKGLYNHKKGNGDMVYGKFDNTPSFNNEYYPTELLCFSNASQKNKVHPTQKPVALMEYLIKTYTNEKETVLDFTAGSFTTGVACVNVNRNFIGIELDNNYFDIGVNRIKERIACLNLETELTISMGG